MKKLILLMVLGMLICLPGMAMADWYATDQGWYDNYPLTGAPSYRLDTIYFYISAPTGTNGLTFGGPGVIDYPSSYWGGFAGWTITAISPTEVMAYNVAAPLSASWNYELAGSPLQNWTLYWNGYYDDNFVMGELDTTVNGSVIGLETGGLYYSDPVTPDTRVSVPPTVLLLGSGLAGLGLLRFRRKA